MINDVCGDEIRSEGRSPVHLKEQFSENQIPLVPTIQTRLATRPPQSTIDHRLMSGAWLQEVVDSGCSRSFTGYARED